MPSADRSRYLAPTAAEEDRAERRYRIAEELYHDQDLRREWFRLPSVDDRFADDLIGSALTCIGEVRITAALDAVLARIALAYGNWCDDEAEKRCCE